MRAYLMSLAVAAPALFLAACGNNAPAEPAAPAAAPIGSAAVNTERLINADSEPGSWLAAGRDYNEQRF
ncbi:MAG: hypothetical protein ABL956_16350, partial [Hyphomonadaceae bacterium]